MSSEDSATGSIVQNKQEYKITMRLILGLHLSTFFVIYFTKHLLNEEILVTH